LASLPLLRLLFWETTIKCNLNCAHCRRLDSNEDAGKDLSTTQAKDLIGQLTERGKAQPFLPVLVFSGGEPLCRDDLFELLNYAKQSGLTTALATNGTLINPTIAKQIRESGLARVAVSLDGATSDVHNLLRKSEGSFEKALEGIEHLRGEEVPFQINITLTKHNAHQLQDIYRLAKSLGAVALHTFMLVPVGCGEKIPETDMLSPSEYEKMLVEISRLDAQADIQVKVTCGPHYERVTRQQGLDTKRAATTGNVPGGRPRGITSRGCLAGLGILFVNHKGDVFPCGYLPVNCGNILETKLKNIWRNSEDLARLRDSNLLEGKCGLCGYREVCGGCRARAYAATGNYMAEEPFCAYVPQDAAH
jgi:radical SAM protein with 4Fe4S-binding SPASM domain